MWFIICIWYLVGCSSEENAKEILSEKYNIGDEIELGDVLFNIYKIDDNTDELYLMAQRSIANTKYSEDNDNNYEYSIVDDYVDVFVAELNSKGIKVNSSGIIEYEDLYIVF